MKKVLKFLGFAFLAVFVFLVAMAILSSATGIDEKEVFIPYMEENIPKLAAWDVEQYQLLMSKKGLESAPSEKLSLYVNFFKKLGQLQSIGDPELRNWSSFMNLSSGRTTYAVYIVPLTFDTGDAHVELGLQHNRGKVEINSVNFMSDQLLK